MTEFHNGYSEIDEFLWTPMQNATGNSIDNDSVGSLASQLSEWTQRNTSIAEPNLADYGFQREAFVADGVWQPGVNSDFAQTFDASLISDPTAMEIQHHFNSQAPIQINDTVSSFGQSPSFTISMGSSGLSNCPLPYSQEERESNNFNILSSSSQLPSAAGAILPPRSDVKSYSYPRRRNRPCTKCWADKQKVPFGSDGHSAG